jgi:hypothetical protein
MYQTWQSNGCTTLEILWSNLGREKGIPDQNLYFYFSDIFIWKV